MADSTPPRSPSRDSLVVFDHPLIRSKMTILRDEHTSHRPFRAVMAQIAGLMVYEVTRTFETVEIEVQTPMEKAVGYSLRGSVTVVPVLRAGLGMVHGVLDVMPEARVGHLGLARDEQTLKPKAYLNKLPKDLNAGPVIMVDPMLATGGSASAAIQTLKNSGARDVRALCLVGSPEGVDRLLGDHPGLPIYLAALDERLNEKGYIMPGLGDAGDRLYGTA